MQSSLPVEQRTQCVHTTARGTQCSRLARAGEQKCQQHAGHAQARTPTAIDDTRQEAFFSFLKDGLSLDHAASLAGIPRSTVYDWLRRAKEPTASDAYRAFAAGVEVARAELERKALRSLLRAAEKGEWRAGVRLLELLDPETFGRRGTGRPAGQMGMGELGAAEDNPRQPDNVVPIGRKSAGGDW